MIDLSSVQDVTFVGAGADKTTLLPLGDFSGGFATGTYVTNLTVSGIAFSGFKSSVFNLTTIHKLTISACKFLNNSAANGPALFGKDIFDGLVTGSRFEDNTSTSNGGAIYLSYASAPREWQDTHLLVKDSVFSGNTAWRNANEVISGSAIYAQYHSMTVDNCLFTRNAGHGQVIYFFGWNDEKKSSWTNGKYEIKNSTIADNYTPIGVTATSRSTQTITNSVIFGQRYPIGIQSGVFQLVDKGDCYWSGERPTTSTSAALRKGPECDPQLDVNLRPPKDSPAYGHGYTFPDDEPPFVTVRDVYVDPAAEEGGDGSQATPYNTFRAAVDNVRSGDRIHLAEGTYPVETYAFTDVRGVEILGEGAGAVFAGDGQTERTEPVFSFTRADRFKVSKVAITGIYFRNASARFGFDIKRCANSKIEDVAITNNVVGDVAIASGSYLGPALYAGDWSTVDARRLNVSDNTLGTATSDGIVAKGLIYSSSSYLTVRESVMRRNYLNASNANSKLEGLASTSGNGPQETSCKGLLVLRDSLFQDNGRIAGEDKVGVVYAIYGAGDCKVRVEHCTFDGFRGRLLGVTANAALIIYNTVFHNFTYEVDNVTDTPGGMWNLHETPGTLYLYNCATDYDYDTLKRTTGNNYLNVQANTSPIVGDPMLDADGMPIDTGDALSSLVDAGYACEFYRFTDDKDFLGKQRVVAYRDKTKSVPDVGCYEIVPPSFRLTTTDVDVLMDGKPHGPSYELTVYDSSQEIGLSFSTESESGPFVTEEPQYVAAGTYRVWVKASAEGGESQVRLSTITITAGISGNAYLAPNGTGGGESEDEPSADVNDILARVLPGTTVHFAAGTYPLSEAMALEGLRDIVLDGTAGAVVEPAEGMKDVLARLSYASNVVIRGFTFRKAAHLSGVLRAYEPTTITDVGIDLDNVAYGGAAYGYCAVDCAFEQCQFLDNAAKGGSSKASLGGAAAFITSTNIVFSHCRFTGNSATAGNGVGAGGALLFAGNCCGVQVVDAVFAGNSVSGQYSSYGYGAAIGAVHSRFAVTNALAMRNTGGQAPVATWGDSENYRNKSMPFELYNCTFADNIAPCGFIAKGWVGGWTGKNLIVDGQFFSMNFDNERIHNLNCANNWWCGDSADLAQTPEFAPHLVRGYVPAKGSGADRANAGWRPWQVTLDASELATREVRVGSLAELAAAFADLRDGDTVRIAEGTYTMDPQAPFAYMISNRIDVAIIGEGAGVTFDGDGGALATTFLTVTNSFNVRIENISLRNASIPWTASTQTPPLAVNVFRSGRVEVEAMSLESLRIVVTGNGINATAGGLISCHTVDAFVMFHDLVVRDVDFDATKAPSATTVAGLAISSAAHLLVRGARFENIRFRSKKGGMMNGVTYDFSGTTGTRVRNCLFTGCGIPDEEGLTGKATLVWKGWAMNQRFENCTFAGNRAICYAGTANGQAYYYNCIFVENAGGFVNTYSGSYANCNFYNCVLQENPGTWSIDSPLAPAGTVAPVSTLTDPIYGSAKELGFKATTGAKAYLPICTGKAESNSPLIDSGAPMSWAKLWADTDLLGNPRVSYGVKPPRQNPPSAVIDRGCYEVGHPIPGLLLMVR